MREEEKKEMRKEMEKKEIEWMTHRTEYAWQMKDLQTAIHCLSVVIDLPISHGFTGSLVPIPSNRSNQHLQIEVLDSFLNTLPSPSLNHMLSL